ncbi:MAG: protein-disulfide reductase DsbD [Sulfurimonas sp.]|nr:protein-disulfide reductase DsbD [Sulfurimonas sp.]MBU3939081.1 protein-disulfide reductase DsbD [bacterium]MBU4025597.1 protein-disulfide reductase DsbD [bacterium]MBU4058046.1 protein-disulfide reductase DsbD [bacterium]MBU4109903.1 protein-disulfide reductase DsbD [bacterium]
MKKIVLFFSLVFALLAAPPKFLMPDEAFVPNAVINENMQLEADVTLAKDIYLYVDKTKLELDSQNGMSIKEISTSAKEEEHEGDIVYLESPHFVVVLQKEEGVKGVQNVQFTLSYQGCSEQGLCYEPLHKTYSFEVDTSKLDVKTQKVKSLDITTLNEMKESENTKVAKPEESSLATQELSQTDSIADTIKSESVAFVLLTFLGFGLLLAMTPCVFPMIPIISGVIISQGQGLSTKKAFALSLVYVLAMAVAYTIAGVLAGLFGSNLQAALQTPWVIYSFALIFVALAFSMFGFYELKLPDKFVTKISSKGHRAGYLGVAVMGFLSALIVGPCVAAPLAGALVYIGQTGDALLGGMALFSMSIGMGIPLIAVGVSAGKFMPKPGAWMTMVTAVFGVMMLGVAIWMLERIVDRYTTMILYSVLGLGFALYLNPFEREGHIFKRSVALVLFAYATALFIGALGGSTSMTKPLEFLKPQTASVNAVSAVKHKKFIKVTSIEELDVLLAKNKGKKILLDFSAEWCTACTELEEVTFANADVKTKMDDFVLINADVTANGEKEKALSKKYGVFGPPVILFFDEKGNVIQSKTIVGFVPPAEFLAHLNTF